MTLYELLEQERADIERTTAEQLHLLSAICTGYAACGESAAAATYLAKAQHVAEAQLFLHREEATAPVTCEQDVYFRSERVRLYALEEEQYRALLAGLAKQTGQTLRWSHPVAAVRETYIQHAQTFLREKYGEKQLQAEQMMRAGPLAIRDTAEQLHTKLLEIKRAADNAQ